MLIGNNVFSTFLDLPKLPIVADRNFFRLYGFKAAMPHAFSGVLVFRS